MSFYSSIVSALKKQQQFPRPQSIFENKYCIIPFGEVLSKEDGTATVSCIHSHLHVAELKHYKHTVGWGRVGVPDLWATGRL